MNWSDSITPAGISRRDHSTQSSCRSRVGAWLGSLRKLSTRSQRLCSLSQAALRDILRVFRGARRSQPRNPRGIRARRQTIPGVVFRSCVAGLEYVTPIHISRYVDTLRPTLAPPTIKVHISALRKCFDQLVSEHVVATNPARSVESPRHVVRVGLTPCLTRPDPWTIGLHSSGQHMRSEGPAP